jgi:hypothetical protein
MSIVRTYSVFCDFGRDGGGWPCAQWVAETTESPAAARRIARGEGWTRHQGRDLCPTHSEAVRDERGGEGE